MLQPPFDARCLFLDGPVAICVHDGPWTEEQILEAYTRLGRLVAVAARQLGKPFPHARPTDRPMPS